jgi:hypothetical protein
MVRRHDPSLTGRVVPPLFVGAENGNHQHDFGVPIWVWMGVDAVVYFWADYNRFCSDAWKEEAKLEA